MRESSVFLKISLSHSADVSRMQPKNMFTPFICAFMFIYLGCRYRKGHAGKRERNSDVNHVFALTQGTFTLIKLYPGLCVMQVATYVSDWCLQIHKNMDNECPTQRNAFLYEWVESTGLAMGERIVLSVSHHPVMWNMKLEH